MRTLAAMIFYGAYSVFIEYNNLAGEQISYELSADRVKSAAFGGNYICSLVCYAVAERSEAVLVTGGDKLCRRHDNERICAVYLIHRTVESLFYRRSFKPFLCYKVAYNFGVACRMEDRALLFKLVT